MGRRYVPGDMIRASDFKEMFAQISETEKANVVVWVQRLIDENPSDRLGRGTVLLYYMIHYLMSDLYVSLAIYHVRQESGEDRQLVLRQIDEALVCTAKKMNDMLRVMMRLPGAFRLARAMIPKTFVKANGHGFTVEPVDLGKDGFGFDVTECPYSRLYAQYGVPELGPVLCHFDDVESGNLPGIDFVRTGTLCRGCDRCDFRYLRKTKA